MMTATVNHKRVKKSIAITKEHKVKRAAETITSPAIPSAPEIMTKEMGLNSGWRHASIWNLVGIIKNGAPNDSMSIDDVLYGDPKGPL